jgi:transcriptional regulator with XRE-family HTH domain
MTTRRVLEADLDIGARLRTARLAAGLTQERLGKKLGITFQQIQKYEKGANRLSGSRLVQAAEAVGVTPAYFFGTNDANGKKLSEANFDLFKLIDSADMVRLLRAASKIKQPARMHLIRLAESMAAA